MKKEKHQKKGDPKKTSNHQVGFFLGLNTDKKTGTSRKASSKAKIGREKGVTKKAPSWPREDFL